MMHALIQCEGCGKEISENAKKCPNCGEPVSIKIPFSTWLFLILLLVVMYNVDNIDSLFSKLITASTSS